MLWEVTVGGFVKNLNMESRMRYYVHNSRLASFNILKIKVVCKEDDYTTTRREKYDFRRAET